MLGAGRGIRGAKVPPLANGKHHYLWSLESPLSFEEEVGKEEFFFFSSLLSSEASECGGKEQWQRKQEVEKVKSRGTAILSELL